MKYGVVLSSALAGGNCYMDYDVGCNFARYKALKDLKEELSNRHLDIRDLASGSVRVHSAVISLFP